MTRNNLYRRVCNVQIDIALSKGLRVDASFNGFTVATDQPEADGGTNTAPSPFDLFLASLATCAGYYVAAFCRERELPTDGIALQMTNDWNDENHRVENINLRISLPDDFPEKYRRAVTRVAGMCTVKRHLDKPPAFRIAAHNGRKA
jgi:ribosomal protein S12 methylthiotransferase accessory factor